MKEKKSSVFRVLFICAGNICRSPMAEAVLKAKVPKSLQNSIEVISAGLNTFSGMSASVEAELACRLKNFDVSKHESRQAGEVLLESCDLILCMEPAQTAHIIEKYPQLSGKVYTFRQFSSEEDLPVEDPYRQDISVYIKTLTKIVAEINKCKTRIWDLARQKKKHRDK